MSTATACNLPYFEDAGLNAAAVLQQQIFKLQVDQFQSVSTFHENQSSLSQCNDLHISELLLVPSRKIGHSRCLDNEEITILGLLDSDGRLTLSSRMTEFMIMMTRVSRMDHRALLVEILTSQTSESCEKQFVSHGGLRLLKLWIKIAEEENNLHELIALVKLCRKLPFDEKAIKETGGLGKSIRKLLKFKHSSPDLNTLNEEIRALVGHWTQQAENAMNSSTQKAAVVKIEDSVDTPQMSEMAILLSEKMVKLRGNEAKEETKPLEQDTSVKINIPADAKSSFEPRPNLANEAKGVKPTSESKTVSNSIKQSLPPLIEKVYTPGDMIDITHNDSTTPDLFNPSLASTMELLALHNANLSINNNHKTLPTAQPAAVREKKVADMAEGARKLLAIKAQAQSKNLLEVDNTNASMNTTSASTSEILPPVVIKVLRSAMKKSLSSSTTTSAEEDLANKEKKNAGIRWADEHGQSLREVHTIEVEKIKNTVASYKSHRDLVRKERQLEKDTHLSKVHDAMQRTAAWRTPLKPLNVSIEVLTNREGPVVSQEKDLQTRRLGLVLEVAASSL